MVPSKREGTVHIAPCTLYICRLLQAVLVAAIQVYRHPVVPSKREGVLHCSMYPLHLFAVAGCVGGGYTDVPWSRPNGKGQYTLLHVRFTSVDSCRLCWWRLYKYTDIPWYRPNGRGCYIAPCTLYICRLLQGVLVAATQTSRGPVQTGRDATWPQSAPSSFLSYPPKAGSQQSSTLGNFKLIHKV